MDARTASACGAKGGHRHAARVIPILWVTIIAFVAFVIIALSIETTPVAAIDRFLLLSLREPLSVGDPLGPVWFQEAVADITALGGIAILTIMVGLVGIGLIVLRKPAVAAYLVLSVLGGTLLSNALKALFARSRPDLVTHLDHTLTNSFPSGHATVSTLTLLTLAAVACRFSAQPGFRTFAITSAIVIAVLIGASRVYLGVHWPSDVIAGWALGIGWAGTVWLVANLISRHAVDAPDLGQ